MRFFFCLSLLVMLAGVLPLEASELTRPSNKSATQPQTKKHKDNLLSSAELELLLKKLKSQEQLKVDFTQKIQSRLRKRPRSYSGVAYFAKPRKFRWVKNEPIEESYIYNGKELIIYRPKENRATKFSQIGSRAKQIEQLSSLILNLSKLQDFYEIKEPRYHASEKSVTMQLRPKKPTAELEKIEVKVSYKHNFVEIVKLVYKKGTAISYHFSNPSTKVKPTRFEFSRPKGVKLEVFD